MASFDDAVLRSLAERNRMFYPPRRDKVILGPRMFDRIRRDAVAFPHDGQTTYFGLKIHVSNLFPYTLTCGACQGTGEGRESTYCPVCKGAGASRTEGVITGDGDTITLITSPLPKRFAVGWPSSVEVRRRPAIRGGVI